MRKSAFISLLITCTFLAGAQPDSLVSHNVFSKGWHSKAQFAGSIGFISVGAGRSGKKLEADLWYGYVPQSLGGVTIHTITAKVTWSPVRVTQIKNLAIRPLSLGSFVSYTPGRQYFLFDPEEYPFGYYGYPTAIHVGLFAGGQVAVTPKKNKYWDRWALYYELGTTDVRLASYFTNARSLPLSQVFTLGLGVKHIF